MPSSIKSLLFLSSYVLSIACSAQEFEAELKDAIHARPRIEARFDSRTSFINQTGVRVSGFKLGVQFDNKLSFGLGYNYLGSKLRRYIEAEGTSYFVRLRFNVISPYLEYIFYRDKRWELSIPVQFGFGESFYSNENDIGPNRFEEGFVMTYEPAITFQYRFLSYFGAGMGVGYRLMVVPNRGIEENFTSPVYIFKVKLYFQDILSDIKGD